MLMLDGRVSGRIGQARGSHDTSQPRLKQQQQRRGSCLTNRAVCHNTHPDVAVTVYTLEKQLAR